MPKRKPQGSRKGPRMIAEIKRLQRAGLGKVKIAQALGISKNTVRKYLRQQEESQVQLPTSQQKYSAPWADLIKWDHVRAETVKGVQLKHYWEQWIAPESAQLNLRVRIPYESFWREYKRRYPLIPIDFHKHHPPGERCEVDYKGDSQGLGYFDRFSNTFLECRLFGAILCHSQFFFAKATLTEQQADLLSAVSDAYAYYGGVPHTTVVDNAKASVYRAHRYDPDYSPEFAKFCEHYGTAEIAARPRKPKDKNLIENVLGVFWRWAGPKFRERKFFSLQELNEFLEILLEEFNKRIQRKYQSSRMERFHESEKEKLLPLPREAYQYGIWKKLVVHPDCHLQVNTNFYSAPYQLRGQQLDVRFGLQYVEIFHNLERVAVHEAFPKNQRGRYKTEIKHLPEVHRVMLEFTPRKAIEDAKAIGPSTHKIVLNLFTEARHPLMYLRRVQGILRLRSRYSSKELELACSKLSDIQVKNVRIDDIQRIIELFKTNHSNPFSQSNIKRSSNPNLRGQHSWK